MVWDSILARILLYYPITQSTSMIAQPLVSVVVTTRNSSSTLWPCLESIRLQTYPLTELIVVDNHSTDQSVSIARRFTSQVFVKGPERSAQRNHGILTIGHGSISGYVDADMILGPLVVEEAVNTLQQGCVGVFVPEIILATGLYGRVRRYERSCYSGTSIDAVRFFWTEAFRRVGGFDESLPPGPEDWDLTMTLQRLGRLGEVSNLVSRETLVSWSLATYCSQRGVLPESLSSLYHDEGASGFSKVLNKKMYYASGLSQFREKWLTLEGHVPLQLSPKYRLVGLFISRNNYRRTLRNVHLYVIFLVWKTALGFRILLRSKSR